MQEAGGVDHLAHHGHLPLLLHHLFSPLPSPGQAGSPAQAQGDHRSHRLPLPVKVVPGQVAELSLLLHPLSQPAVDVPGHGAQVLGHQLEGVRRAGPYRATGGSGDTGGGGKARTEQGVAGPCSI